MELRYPRPAVLAELPADGHAVIEASAGTGKTYTIEHLVVDRLLRTGCGLDEILVVTFTEKATSELRRRVRGLIEAVVAHTEDCGHDESWRVDDAARASLEAALFSFDRAPIYTIHGFCNRVLSDLAFDSGQLFEQRFVDTRRAFHRAFRDVLRTHIAVEAGARAHLERWYDAGHDEADLQDLLLDALRNRYLDSETGRADALTDRLAELAADFDPRALRQDYREAAIQVKSLAAAEAAIEAVAAALASPADPEDRLAAIVAADPKAILKPRRTGSRRKRRFPDEVRSGTARFHARLRGLLVHHAQAGALERQVVEAFLPPVLVRMDATKRRDGLLDYDDLLERVWRALSGPREHALVGALRARYAHALIDEFQDTDERQWAIFRKVFVEEGATGSLVVVGDPKQAIYGFRGADVGTYLAARADLVARGAARVRLGTNYRATRSVVDACNRILDQTAPAPFFSGEIRYQEAVECGKPDLSGPAPGVVLWRYKPRPPRGGRSQMELSAWELRDALGRQLASTLAGLLARPPRFDGHPVCARDVLVLVRTSGDARDAARFLDEAGVPYAFYRQDGLFQSTEAADLRDVLAAVAAPHDTSKRLAAFATPWFDVSLAQLPFYRALSSEHPLLRRLHRWHALADQGRLPALFDALLEESGVVERELFGDDDERALTNQRHLLELLLEAATRDRLDLGEVVELLDRYVRGLEAPEGADANIQRLAGERDAVQVMTIHKAKGLEAAVVCLYGGFRSAPSGGVRVVHDGQGRHVLVGEAARQAVADQIEREAAEEDQRLYYVALTRTKARLYLPLIDSSRQIKGSYAALNARLRAMDTDGFGVVEVLPPEARAPRSFEAAPGAPLGVWSPPEPRTPAPVDFAGLRTRHAPLVVTSYTRLKSSMQMDAPIEADEFRVEPSGDVVPGPEALPGGREMGRFLHEAIEGVPFELYAEPFPTWRALPVVCAAFASTMRRHGIEPRWLERSQRVVYETLTRSLTLGERRLEGLWRCHEHVVEMELLYPIPETHHPLLGGGGGGDDFSTHRGYVKGYVDLVFAHRGLTYFADWKSDVLPAYDAASMVPHVRDHYELQARLYTLGLVRLLDLRDAAAYEAAFGGLLYVFLRGFGEDSRAGDGVYFDRPAWADVVRWETELGELRT